MMMSAYREQNINIDRVEGPKTNPHGCKEEICLSKEMVSPANYIWEGHVLSALLSQPCNRREP